MAMFPSRKCSTVLSIHLFPRFLSRSFTYAVCVYLLLLAFGSVRPVFAQGGIITTIVGGGPNGATALSVDLGQPGSVTIDPVGNIILSANAKNQVFKIDTMGNFSVLAGTGVAGFSGDNGFANAARSGCQRVRALLKLMN